MEDDLRRVEDLLARAVRGLQNAGNPRYVYEVEAAATDAESALEALRGVIAEAKPLAMVAGLDDRD